MAQEPAVDSSAIVVTPEKKEPRPFRILTSGRHITIKCDQPIRRIMGWTASGHRFIENNDVNGSSCEFTIPGMDKFAFVMVQFRTGKHYTEKIGIE
jgi:hypothetical protein